MELLPIVDLRLSGRTRRSSGCAASEALLSSLVPHGLLSQAGNFRFGSKAYCSLEKMGVPFIEGESHETGSQ